MKGENTMERIEKRKSHAFGKDVYLLGTKKTGEKIWLGLAKWDCGWYWGFGYIEEYTNNNYPDRSRDINSHSHWKGLMGKQEYYDHKKGCFRLGNDYIHHLNDHPDMADTVLTDSESWELADLMKTFYTLKETAELYHSGNSHISNPKLSLKNKRKENHINMVELPKVFERIYRILTNDDNSDYPTNY